MNQFPLVSSVRNPLAALLCLAACLSTVWATTYPEVTDANFPSGMYSDSKGKLPYRYFVPVGYNADDASTKYPLVLFLHGDGEKGTDNAKQLGKNANGAMIFISKSDPDNQHDYPCFWIAPQVSGDRIPSQLEGLVTDFMKHFNVDPDRIYITGISGGGGFVWNTLASYPERYAAAIAIAGWGTGKEEKHKNVPLWAFHCIDDRTVTVKGSEDAVGRLRAAGGHPIFTLYETGGHGGSWTNAFNAKTPIVPWIMAQRRGQPGNLSPIERINVTSPTLTNGAAVVYSGTLDIEGTAGDETAGIKSVAWTNLKSHATGTATGTGSWTISGIELQSGKNIIRFMATGASYPAPGNGETTFSSDAEFDY